MGPKNFLVQSTIIIHFLLLARVFVILLVFSLQNEEVMNNTNSLSLFCAQLAKAEWMHALLLKSTLSPWVLWCCLLIQTLITLNEVFILAAASIHLWFECSVNKWWIHELCHLQLYCFCIERVWYVKVNTVVHVQTISSSAVNTVTQNGRSNESDLNKQRLSREELASLKARWQCHKCDKYGYWSSDHNSGGSIKSSGKCNNTLSTETSSDRSKNAARKIRNSSSTITFNMAQKRSGAEAKFETLGPVLGDCAQCSGLGMCRL